MKYKNPDLTPVGGWKFKYLVEKNSRFPNGEFIYSNNGASGLNNFVRLVNTAMIQNGISIPENLKEIVEDYICTYQPEGRCSYSRKLGDQLSKVIHAVASIADKATRGKYKLQSKAKGCSKCAQKRNRLNQG